MHPDPECLSLARARIAAKGPQAVSLAGIPFDKARFKANCIAIREADKAQRIEEERQRELILKALLAKEAEDRKRSKRRRKI